MTADPTPAPSTGVRSRQALLNEQAEMIATLQRELAEARAQSDERQYKAETAIRAIAKLTRETDTQARELEAARADLSAEKARKAREALLVIDQRDEALQRLAEAERRLGALEQAARMTVRLIPEPYHQRMSTLRAALDALAQGE